jgi:hypothetical protein
MSKPKNKPIVSGAIAAAGLTSIFAMATATDNDLLAAAALYTAFASPLLSGVAAGKGAIDLFKKRPGLSKVFSAAAVGVGAAGAVLPIMPELGGSLTLGGEGFAALVFSTQAMTGAAVSNIMSDLIANSSSNNSGGDSADSANDKKGPKPPSL